MTHSLGLCRSDLEQHRSRRGVPGTVKMRKNDVRRGHKRGLGVHQ